MVRLESFNLDLGGRRRSAAAALAWPSQAIRR
jgi:hypothetical protein